MNQTHAFSALILLNFVACDSLVPSDAPVDSTESGVMGTWSYSTCSAPEKIKIDKAKDFGRVIASSKLFEQCIIDGLIAYKPCTWVEQNVAVPLRLPEPTVGVSSTEYLRMVLAVMMSPRPVVNACGQIGFFSAQANPNPWGNNASEAMEWSTNFLAQFASPPTPDQAILMASVAWHEISHSHGFLHDKLPGFACEYSGPPPAINTDIPHLVDSCIRASGTEALATCSMTACPGNGFMMPKSRGSMICECVKPGCRDFVDFDSDGLGDACDSCPQFPGIDTDVDGVCANDNCQSRWNPNQKDFDSDGLGDVCDPCKADPTTDVDNDGLCSNDNCPMHHNPGQADTDGDGTGNRCDADIDGDMHPNGPDNCDYDPNPDQKDSDHDGVGDVCDCSAGNFTVAVPHPTFVCNPIAGTYKWNLLERRLANVIRYLERAGIEGPWAPMGGCAIVACSSAPDRGYSDAQAYVNELGVRNYNYADLVAIIRRDPYMLDLPVQSFIDFRQGLRGDYATPYTP